MFAHCRWENLKELEVNDGEWIHKCWLSWCQAIFSCITTQMAPALWHFLMRPTRYLRVLIQSSYVPSMFKNTSFQETFLHSCFMVNLWKSKKQLYFCWQFLMLHPHSKNIKSNYPSSWLWMATSCILYPHSITWWCPALSHHSSHFSISATVQVSPDAREGRTRWTTVFMLADLIRSTPGFGIGTSHCGLYTFYWLVVGPPLWKIWVRQLG